MLFNALCKKKNKQGPVQADHHMNDEEFDVYYRAIEILAQIGDPKAQKTLTQIDLADPNISELVDRD